MKRSMFNKVFSFILCLVLATGLLPAVSIQGALAESLSISFDWPIEGQN